MSIGFEPCGLWSLFNLRLGLTWYLMSKLPTRWPTSLIAMERLPHPAKNSSMSNSFGQNKIQPTLYSRIVFNLYKYNRYIHFFWCSYMFMFKELHVYIGSLLIHRLLKCKKMGSSSSFEIGLVHKIRRMISASTLGQIFAKYKQRGLPQIYQTKSIKLQSSMKTIWKSLENLTLGQLSWWRLQNNSFSSGESIGVSNHYQAGWFKRSSPKRSAGQRSRTLLKAKSVYGMNFQQFKFILILLNSVLLSHVNCLQSSKPWS